MAFNYPYGDTQQLNLNWFLAQWETFREQWATAEEGIDHALDAEIARVEAAMTDLYAARDAAAASKTAAQTAATNAASSATVATQQATLAQSYANTAQTQAGIATAAAEAAGNSASSASTSATAANLSKTQAANSATAAQTAQTAAEAAETNIVSIITDAIQDAADAAAATATADAEAAADAAEASATAAAGSASDASDSATAAAGSASDAADSATAAAGSATAAAGSASDAADSATAAAASAASIVVDSAMSDSSTNPVQNKVINREITELKTAITQLEDDLGVPQNLYNANTKNVGYRVSISNGTLSGQQDQNASDYVPVVAGKTYVLNFSYWSSASYGMAFYDSTKTFIDGSGIKQSTINASSEIVPFVFTVPANAYYLRFSMLQSYTTPVTLYEVVTNKIDLITETALLSDSLYDNGILSFNDVDFTVSSGIRTAASSTLKSDNVNYTHTSISVNSGEIYLVRGVSFAAGYPCWILLDSNGNTVDYSPTSGQTGDIVKTERVLVPENASTLWVNNYAATNYIAIRKAASKNTINEWNGKKIVWFGTSIPAGNTGSGSATGRSYPGILGGLLGATVYNESIGSSRVRGGSYHNTTENDPMGWAGMSAIGVMYSLSLSSAEKQAICDSWDSKWSSIIGNPSTVNMANIETYKSSSWDVILPKYLTGGSVGQCDLYVFDHGYNEGVASYGFTEMSEVPATQDDRTYWIGAMNFIIGKILADNPKAKIMIVGHYMCNGSQAGGANYDTKYVCEAQKKFADMWGFYCVPTWNLLGLSCQPITVGGTTKTVVAARFPDAIHPASDTTGKENDRYANALLPQFSLAVST